MAAEPPATVGDRALVFRAGGRVFACDVSAVREVVPLDGRARFARVPGAPPSVLGVLNLRGSIVTVADGGVLLRGRGVAGDRTMVLIVDVGVRGVGLAVDRVADVRALRADEGYQQLDVREVVARAVTILEE